MPLPVIAEIGLRADIVGAIFRPAGSNGVAARDDRHRAFIVIAVVIVVGIVVVAVAAAVVAKPAADKGAGCETRVETAVAMAMMMAIDAATAAKPRAGCHDSAAATDWPTGDA